MLVHYFQIILNFLYVCQSVSWLTSLLKLDKYRDISIFGWNIFLKFFWDIGLLIFTLLGWAFILTFECLCAGLNFETSGLVTFCFSWGQLLRPLVLLFFISSDITLTMMNSHAFKVIEMISQQYLKKPSIILILLKSWNSW